ncbi:2-oxodicarboxylate carrier 2 [Fusarium oxysporum f. sp. albedinis]|nr:2-oxodicarboxylate carrier 2 [Fusarium oxysporum f. sp. albedinis]
MAQIGECRLLISHWLHYSYGVRSNPTRSISLPHQPLTLSTQPHILRPQETFRIPSPSPRILLSPSPQHQL